MKEKNIIKFLIINFFFFHHGLLNAESVDPAPLKEFDLIQSKKEKDAFIQSYKPRNLTQNSIENLAEVIVKRYEKKPDHMILDIAQEHQRLFDNNCSSAKTNIPSPGIDSSIQPSKYKTLYFWVKCTDKDQEINSFKLIEGSQFNWLVQIKGVYKNNQDDEVILEKQKEKVLSYVIFQ